jgi:hypothetical protein
MGLVAFDWYVGDLTLISIRSMFLTIATMMEEKVRQFSLLPKTHRECWTAA